MALKAKLGGEGVRGPVGIVLLLPDTRQSLVDRQSGAPRILEKPSLTWKLMVTDPEGFEEIRSTIEEDFTLQEVSPEVVFIPKTEPASKKSAESAADASRQLCLD
jgi:hypothetical protein